VITLVLVLRHSIENRPTELIVQTKKTTSDPLSQKDSAGQARHLRGKETSTGKKHDKLNIIKRATKGSTAQTLCEKFSYHVECTFELHRILFIEAKRNKEINETYYT